MRVSPARLLAVPVLLVAALAACGAEPALDTPAASAPVVAGKKINLSPDQNRVRTGKVAAIAARVPKEIAADGRLTVGFSAGGSPRWCPRPPTTPP
ncbi:hypothetical protein ACFQ0B_41450 [Nonomuraea thailandensis]